MIAPDRAGPTFLPPDLAPDALEGLPVLIFGLGGFGGGVGAARFLAERGAQVTITDQRGEEDLATSLHALERVPIARWRLGGHDRADFREARWVVVNPAVPPGSRELAEAARTGARLVTEVGLFLSWSPTRFVAGITGSNGKSTTCRLLADLLAASGHRVHLGGNFGGSLLDTFDTIHDEDRVVLELSSFQLARLGRGTPRPAAVAITQLAANHLDWHGSLEAYRIAKAEILAPPPPTSPRDLRVAAIPREHPELAARAHMSGRRVIPVSASNPGETGIGVRDDALVEVDGGRVRTLAALERFPRRGAPHYANAAIACALGLPLGVDRAVIEPTIADQHPLPHRQEPVEVIDGVTYIDDSKATTPEAACAALDAVPPAAVLLAGGRDKGGDFTPIAAALRAEGRRAVCYGECREALAGALRRGGVPPERVELRPDLTAAFLRATELATPGGVVLLSPACASFDEFRSFEERAARYRALVAEHARSRR